MDRTPVTVLLMVKKLGQRVSSSMCSQMRMGSGSRLTPQSSGKPDFSNRIICGTMIYTTIDQQPHIPPFPIPLRECCSYEPFFSAILELSNILEDQTREINLMSIKFNRIGKQNEFSLQRGNFLHWQEFYRQIREAWKATKDFEDGKWWISIRILARSKREGSRSNVAE